MPSRGQRAFPIAFEPSLFMAFRKVTCDTTTGRVAKCGFNPCARCWAYRSFSHFSGKEEHEQESIIFHCSWYFYWRWNFEYDRAYASPGSRAASGGSGSKAHKERLPQLPRPLRQTGGNDRQVRCAQRRKDQSPPVCAARFKEGRGHSRMHELPRGASARSVADARVGGLI